MLHTSTFEFLTDLSKNNNREWFQLNKKRFEVAKQEVETFVDELLSKMVLFDSSIGELKGKDCLMRIYRDVRFSKNKDPYKKNFGIVISSVGRNVNGPCYYLHIEPGQVFVAGGYWMPSADHLKAIRQEIDYNTNDFKKIIESKSFIKTFGQLSEEEKLKIAPTGYPKDHPEIELLKNKSFIASSRLDDSALTTASASETVVAIFKEILPLNIFLQQAISH
ncbi:DUF2461 domain-containing protein [Solitalea koreensis]|uniref:TIGR02453 family protein n=1 Tax=Solitalea koreensis TaxID=543615 RepID=A0A521AWB1_9SPHI|nr:DUF2461 domain-containing protein [Solitalea koreensis]SMO38860.1 TIGR02453 family protein [Solitalea koreensis]